MTKIKLKPEELIKYLNDKGYKTNTIKHKPLFTVEDSKKIKQKGNGANTKNLFMKDKKSNYFLITAEQDTKINLKELHHTIGAKGRMSFGAPEKLLELLGVIPGSVTVFGLINDKQKQVRFILDEKLTKYESINCHPLTNEATTNIKYKDLVSFIETSGHNIEVINFEEQEKEENK